MTTSVVAPPARERISSPLAFSCVFGRGLASFICAALITWACGSWWPVAIYLMAIMAITFCTTLFAPETLDRDLLREEDAR